MISRTADLASVGAQDVQKPSSIESWLSLFSRLLRLPDANKKAIVDELDQHLRERVRDLMLGGQSETDALRLAIDELGGAAELAERFRAASRPRQRRFLMNAALIGAGAISVVTASVLISSSSRGPSVAFYEPPAAESDRALLGDTMISVAFNETPLPEVFAFIGEALDSDVIVHWGDLEECDVGRDRTVSLKLDRRRPVSQVLGFLRKSLDPGTRQLALDWRYADGLLELGTVEYFDRRETVMSSFDVGDILARIDEEHSIVRFESIEKLCELVYTYVEPNSWESNGGNIARLMVVGPKMFIRAPARYYARIEWILGQLADGEPTAQRAGSGAR